MKLLNFLKKELLWLFKIGWVKVESRSKSVYIKGKFIGVEFYVTYKNIKTGNEQVQWIPAAP